ncbi:MAG: ATP-binding cassette domain-containing protein, partial [Candidatus Roseilinea sp.]|uniref:ATP-binding cassette domain-containing protein n=1 Tax=Candidatus Roseilinea sp. TaxID=2838777 RepID=UPI00404925AB
MIPASETTQTDNILLEVKNLKKYFPIQKGLLRRTVGYVRAVDDVSLYLREGETLGLVGESGCGKTTASRCIIRLYEPTAGEIWFKSRALSNNGQYKRVNLVSLNREEITKTREEIAMI